MKLQSLLKRMLPFAVLLFILCSGVWMMSRRAVAPGRRGPGAGFAFDSERFLKTDPAMLIATEVAPILIPLAEPLNFCAGPENRLYVVGDNRLVTLQPDGEVADLVLAFDATARCVAVGVDGTVYVGVGDHVETFSSKGEPLARWPVPAAGALLSEIAVAGDFAFVTDRRHAALYRYRTDDGEILEQHRGFTLFSSPVLSVAAAAGNTFWIANPGVRGLRHYSAEGQVLAQWNREGRDLDGFSGCCNPASVAVLPGGNLLVSEMHILRVKIIRPDGSLVGLVAGPDAFDPQTPHLNVGVDAAGRILVLDPVRRQIRVFDIQKSKIENRKSKTDE
jgi:hypothetical protein